MSVRIINADVMAGLRQLPDESIHCVVTSPPYFGLRDYDVEGQIGLEATPEAFVARLAEVFHEVRRVLRDDGVLWLNLGDSYANDSKWGGATSGKHAEALHGNSGIGRGKKQTGLKSKDLIGIPWMVAFALRADGWYLRNDVIWSKPNPMPESVTDRCTKAHEYIFMLTKSERYYFDAEAIKEPAAEPERQRNDRIGGANGHTVRHSQGGMIGASETRNKRSVWTVPTAPYPEAHFATFPPALIEPMILAGCPVGGTVLDPFSGSGTTCLVADRQGRNGIGIELNPDYVAMSERRILGDAPLFTELEVA
jgi:DNA modification methylase